MIKEVKEVKGKIIDVTDNFRIIQETDQYVTQQLITIDPTKFKAYNPEKHKDMDTTIRKEWRNTSGCYFTLSAKGLEAAIKSLIIKEAGMNDDEMNLADYLMSLREIANVVHEKVKHLY